MVKFIRACLFFPDASGLTGVCLQVVSVQPDKITFINIFENSMLTFCLFTPPNSADDSIVRFRRGKLA